MRIYKYFYWYKQFFKYTQIYQIEIMKRIGIVACEIFEEELLKLLSEYDNIDRIILVSSDSSKEFQRILSLNITMKKSQLQENCVQQDF